MMYHQLLSTSTSISPPLLCDSRSDISTESEERDHHTDLHSHPISLSITHFSSKAKSSLCRNFTEKGFCPYGKKCQFAHGPQQLRINMQNNHSYKTKTCHAFEKKGYCCYGSRCNFIHQLPPTIDLRDKWTAIYNNHREIVKVSQRRQDSRLLQLLGK